MSNLYDEWDIELYITCFDLYGCTHHSNFELRIVKELSELQQFHHHRATLVFYTCFVSRIPFPEAFLRDYHCMMWTNENRWNAECLLICNTHMPTSLGPSTF